MIELILLGVVYVFGFLGGFFLSLMLFPPDSRAQPEARTMKTIDPFWLLAVDGVLLALAAPGLIQEGNVAFLTQITAVYVGMCSLYGVSLIVDAIRVVWSHRRGTDAR